MLALLVAGGRRFGSPRRHTCQAAAACGDSYGRPDPQTAGAGAMASTFCFLATGYGLETYRLTCDRANSKTRGRGSLNSQRRN